MRRRRYSRLRFCSSPFDMGRSHHAVESAHGAAGAGEHGGMLDQARPAAAAMAALAGGRAMASPLADERPVLL
jgi:hypothetical protein